MATVTLGSQVHSLTVRLTRGADFVSVLNNTTGNWGTAVVELRIDGGVTWTATTAGAVATFDIDAAAVDAVLDARPRAVRLYVVDGTVDACWATGSIQAQ